jgi:hypothetical protein
VSTRTRQVQLFRKLGMAAPGSFMELTQNSFGKMETQDTITMIE